MALTPKLSTKCRVETQADRVARDDTDYTYSFYDIVNGRPELVTKSFQPEDTVVRGEATYVQILDAELVAASDDTPYCYARGRDSQDWLYKGRVYHTKDADLTSDDFRALLNVAANRRRIELQKAHALEAMTADLSSASKRVPFPREVKITVWQRDNGRCVECGSNESLEFDHVIPVSMGGANTARNLQLLCESCNRRKGASLG